VSPLLQQLAPETTTRVLLSRINLSVFQRSILTAEGGEEDYYSPVNILVETIIVRRRSSSVNSLVEIIVCRCSSSIDGGYANARRRPLHSSLWHCFGYNANGIDNVLFNSDSGSFIPEDEDIQEEAAIT